MKYKLVAFDLDGTLIDNIDFIWNKLHDYFGVDKEIRAKHMNDFLEGRITYQEWLDTDLKLWIEKGVTKDHIIAAIQDIKLVEGTLETIQKLKNQGLRIALISGSINVVFEQIFRQHQMLFDHVFLNKLVFGEGGRIIGGKATPYDMDRKAEGLKHIAESEGISVEECVFVGDHHNDIEIAKTAGLSIAFNPQDENLAGTCDVIIQNKDLREILKYIE